MEIDKKAIESKIKTINSLCHAITSQLESNDEYKKQMAFNIACYLEEFVEFNSKMMGLYIKTGMSLATDENVNHHQTEKLKPHPIYVWEEDNEEEEPSCRKIPDALKRILKEILEDE